MTFAAHLFRFEGVSLICSGGWRLMTSWFFSEKSTNTPRSGWHCTRILVTRAFVDKRDDRTALSYPFAIRQHPWQGNDGASIQDDTSLFYYSSQRGFPGVKVKLMRRPDELWRKPNNQCWRRRRVRRSDSKISKFQRWNGRQPPRETHRAARIPSFQGQRTHDFCDFRNPDECACISRG